MPEIVSDRDQLPNACDLYVPHSYQINPTVRVEKIREETSTLK
jgi:hypothetical protein